MERELLLLGLLRTHGMHGYQLLEFVDTQMAFCVDLKKPTAYFILDKMAASGWIEFEQRQDGNRPPRRVYHITPEGEVIFQRLLRENLASYAPTRFTTDIGLAFSEVLPSEESIHLLEDRLIAVQEQLTAAQNAPPHPGGIQLIIEHQIHHLTSELQWLTDVIQKMRVEGANS